MAIKSIAELQGKKKAIDLTGPEGNAFVLLAYAKLYAKQLGKDWDKLLKEMTSVDYNTLVKIFDREFGEYVDLYK